MPVNAASRVMPAKIAMKRQPSSRTGIRKFASMNAPLKSARLPAASVGLGQGEHLAGVYQIRVANLVFVGVKNDGVAQPLAIMGARDVPEIVAMDDMQPPVVAGDRDRFLPLEGDFQPRGRLAVAAQPIEPQDVLAGRDRFARREAPAPVLARLALARRLVVDIGAHMAARRRLAGDRHLPALVIVQG